MEYREPDRDMTRDSVSVEERLARNMATVRESVRMNAPDAVATPMLVRAARGNRSIRTFANEMGGSASTVSRIEAGQTAEITKEMVAKIATYAAEDSGVTLQKLMQAQGFVSRGDRAKQSRMYETQCRRIISDYMLLKGYSVKYKEATGMNRRFLFDFVITTDALTGIDEDWCFECKTLSPDSAYPVGIGRSRILLDSMMAYYYCGGKAARMSIVVDRRDAFSQICERLSEFRIADEISVIQIDIRQGKVVDEYIAPLTSGREPKSIFAKEEDRDE